MTGLRILLLGPGDLGCRVLDLLARLPGVGEVVVGGRDLTHAERRGNLAYLTAFQLGRANPVRAERVDLDNHDETAETLARLRPDVVFNATSLQSWRIITELPKPVFEQLDEAQLGPWLPMHLTPAYKLMRAVRDSGRPTRVVNAAYPDAVNPVLARAGLAPTIGIGNVANIVPGLTCAAAHLLGLAPERVQLRLVAQHYFTHFVPRFGHAGEGAYHLSASVDGRAPECELDHAAVFAQLNGRLRRLGGRPGQNLTAASAITVLAAMAADAGGLVHAPGPHGLPGGYPVRVGLDVVRLDLPSGLSREGAIEINERCQQADGIDHIAEDGTVHFREREMRIMEGMLGYRCRAMSLADCEGWARELADRYRAFRSRHADS